MVKHKGIEIDGFQEIYKKLGLLEEEIAAAALEGINKLGEVILGESQKLVPRDSGTLARSGVINLGGTPENFNEIYQLAKDKNNTTPIKGFSREGKKTTVTISYNTPYARKQHEDNTLNHPRGGQAKYLERPFNEKSGEAETYIADALQKKLRKKY